MIKPQRLRKGLVDTKGYEVIQGSGKVVVKLLGGCII